MNPRKVPNACERCRRQKLKCDLERPCTLCARTNVECVAAPIEKFKTYRPPIEQQNDAQDVSDVNRGEINDFSGPKRSFATYNPRTGTRGESGERRTKRPRRQSVPVPQQTPLEGSPEPGTPWNSSSTITFVQEAFHHHLASTPEEADTSAFLATPWVESTTRFSRESGGSNTRGNHHHNTLQNIISHHFEASANVHHHRRKAPAAAERDLVPLLPPVEAATLLVDNYFDRIHWFMLLFHQRDFRRKFYNIYNPADDANLTQTTSLGDIAVLLAVLANSLQYINDLQRRELIHFGVDPESLKEKILDTLRLRLLDLLSLGTLEVVQTCVLLGSYYLYHGEPELAWPLCGCALRIAQALNLHRRPPDERAVDHALKPTIEARKRCWWAVYEIETFCSMLYGFPLSISDSDCDVEPLDPYDECSGSTVRDHSSLQPTLLFYKCAMSNLSAIVKSALVDLYGPHRNRDRSNECRSDQGSQLSGLVEKVESLNERLLRWNENIAPKLRLGTLDVDVMLHSNKGLHQDDSIRTFEEHLFQLQTLALKLAFENAKILIHRPLLSFKIVPCRSSYQHNKSGSNRLDPFSSAIRTCRDAALQISLVGLSPTLREAADTYAVAFMSLHLFTAAVTLCIITSLDPLSQMSHECKLGIRRLMETQNILKEKSIVAAQGLDITRRLMSLAIAKEINAMFGVTSSSASDERRPSARPSDINLTPNRGDIEGVPVQMPARTDGLNQPNAVPEVNIEPNTSLSRDLNLTPAGLESSAFEFCENPCMTEVLMDFGQMITQPVTRNAGTEQMPINDPFGNLDNGFVGQDQGWIWGWEL